MSLLPFVTGIYPDVTEISNNLTGISQSIAAKEVYIKITTSCQDVHKKCTEYIPVHDRYKILTKNNTEEYIYCAFTRCGIPGPWARVAYLSMSDSSSVCPSGTQMFVSGSVTACGLQEPSNQKVR